MLDAEQFQALASHAPSFLKHSSEGLLASFALADGWYLEQHGSAELVCKRCRLVVEKAGLNPDDDWVVETA